ncbi:hypothetical protein KO481_11470 [Nocardia sp. NEAU-G5]|uniref:Signal transduction histidine kinase n=1 Tax=Nocardia albiluteola TaxID=2842303 RepID=A0ABS6AVT0_9NOCA|nr:hypothetical protein [Nocardia albiluteola]MBU3062142.1 hypothetical protein [Nocardia albiluteola]
MRDDENVRWTHGRTGAARGRDVRGDAPIGRAQARARRSLGFAVGTGTVLWVLAHLPLIIDQDHDVQAWWTPVVVAGLLVCGIRLLAASAKGSGSGVGAAAGWLAAMLLAGLGTLPLAGDYNCFGINGTWIPPLSSAAAVAGVLVWRRWWPVNLLICGALAAGVDAYTSGGTGIHSVAEDLVRTWVVAGFLAWTSSRLLHAAIELDMMTANAVRHASVAAGAEATERERTRFAGLIHDNVLATLLDVARGGTGEPLRRASARTLRQLDLSPHDYTADDDAPTPEAIEMCRTEAAEYGVPFEAHVGEHAVPRIPREVMIAVAGALGEAARNSLRHAGSGGRTVTRAVRLAVDEGGVIVQIVDDGAGFDLTAVSVERLGVRQSILWRMRCTRGGDASVESAPGRGTTVTLRWTHAESGGAPSQPALIGVRGLSGIVMMALIVLSAGMLMMGYTKGNGSLPAGIAAFGTVIVAGAVVLIPRDDPLPMARTWAVVLAGPLSAAIINLGPHRAHHAVWVVVAYSYVLALLAVRGRVAATLAGLAGAGITFTLANGSLDPAIDGTVVAAAAAFGGIAFTASMRPLLRSYHSARAEIARHAGVEARAAARSLERRSQLAYLDRTARPVLEFLAAGGAPTADQVRECRLLEAEIRDRLRAPGLAVPALVRAAREARARGVALTLLDDGGMGSVAPRVRETIVKTAVAELDSVTEGRVTVRVLPPGRGSIATIVSVEPDTYRRIEIDAAGVPSAISEPAAAG